MVREIIVLNSCVLFLLTFIEVKFNLLSMFTLLITFFFVSWLNTSNISSSFFSLVSCMNGLILVF